MNCSDKTRVFVEHLNCTLWERPVYSVIVLLLLCHRCPPPKEDCTRLTLVSFSSVGCKPTSATEHSVQLDIKSRTTFQLSSAELIIRPFQAVAEDIFISSVGPKHSANPPITALQKSFYLLYLLLPIGWLTDSPTLVVKPTRRQTLSYRAFSVAAARAWNSLPPSDRDAPSLFLFRSRLKKWCFELTLATFGITLTTWMHFVSLFLPLTL